MAYDTGTDAVGMQDIRGENVTRAVTGFALKKYKLKQVCLEQSSTNWKETYYKESAAVLTGAGGYAITGVARMAAFPEVEPTWTETSVRLKKYAAETKFSMEDKITDAIDVQARCMLRVAESITNAVDISIYAAITGDALVNTLAAAAAWDDATEANRLPISDILHGIEYMAIDNYDALENGYLLLSPADYTNLMMNTKVINNPSFKTADVVSNGVVGQICGLKIIVTTSVDADEAAIVIGQLAVTWKSAVPLSTAIITDEGIKYTIRAWEIGVPIVINPEAIHIITNTQT